MTKPKIQRQRRSKIERLIHPSAAPLTSAVAALLGQALHSCCRSPRRPPRPRKPGPVTTGPPAVSTGAVSHPHGTSAELEGIVDPRGAATTYYFQYGVTTAYGQVTSTASLPAGTAKVKVGVAVTGFVVGDHYRLVATNAFGTKTGKDQVYTVKKKSNVRTSQVPRTSRVRRRMHYQRHAGRGAERQSPGLVLQGSPYPYKTTFATVGAPVVTNALGRFTFRIASLTTSTEFRVSTLGGAKPVLSKVFTEHVAVRVTLKVALPGTQAGWCAYMAPSRRQRLGHACSSSCAGL